MMCGYQCHMIGGPYIAENPECPVHGVAAQDRDRAKEGLRDRIHEVLCEVWSRETSADEGLSAIEDLLQDAYE